MVKLTAHNGRNKGSIPFKSNYILNIPYRKYFIYIKLTIYIDSLVGEMVDTLNSKFKIYWFKSNTK